MVYEGKIQGITDSKNIPNKIATELMMEFAPKEAKDIRYSIFPYRQWFEIMFSMSEAEFQSWILEKTEWNISKVDTSDWNSFRYKADDGSKRDILIKSKFYYEGKRPNIPTSSIRIAYDEDQRLCYLRYSSGI